jgi:hypothetical protein
MLVGELLAWLTSGTKAARMLSRPGEDALEKRLDDAEDDEREGRQAGICHLGDLMRTVVQSDGKQIYTCSNSATTW